MRHHHRFLKSGTFFRSVHGGAPLQKCILTQMQNMSRGDRRVMYVWGLRRERRERKKEEKESVNDCVCVLFVCVSER